VVEKDRIVDGRSIRPGDMILGLASSGPHSNGYSLIRKILERPSRRAELTFSSLRAFTSSLFSSCLNQCASKAWLTSPAAV